MVSVLWFEVKAGVRVQSHLSGFGLHMVCLSYRKDHIAEVGCNRRVWTIRVPSHMKSIKENEIGDASHTDPCKRDKPSNGTLKSFDILPFESERQNSLASESDK